MEVLIMLVAGLAFLGTVGAGGYVAFYVGRTMVQDILANPDPLPAWLEAVAPLKGRWLRLFLSAPGVVLCAALIFGLTVGYVGVALAALLFAASFLLGFMR